MVARTQGTVSYSLQRQAFPPSVILISCTSSSAQTTRVVSSIFIRQPSIPRNLRALPPKSFFWFFSLFCALGADSLFSALGAG